MKMKVLGKTEQEDEEEQGQEDVGGMMEALMPQNQEYLNQRHHFRG